MNTYHPDKLPPDNAKRIADLEAKVQQLQDTLALQKRSYEREIELEIAEERERCAKLAETMDPDGQAQGSFELLADKIRARDTAP